MVKKFRKREGDDDNGVVDEEIKRQRATAFDWAQLLLPNAPVIVKILLLLGIGAGTAVTAPKVYQSINGDVDVPAGELVEPQAGQPDYAIAIRAINSKLLKHDEELKAIREERVSGDGALEKRVEILEGHH